MIPIQKYITSPPASLQIAKDSKWEECWIINPAKLPTSKQIATYLDSEPFTSLAIEAIFDESDGHYILGLEISPHLLESTISACQNFMDLDIDLSGDPDLIRIGIVNHWFSIGPIEVWKRGSPKIMSPVQLDRILATKSEVVSTPLNYQGLSFIFNLSSQAHWLKSPCSMYSNGTWTLDPPKILQVLHSWAEFTIT